MHKRLIFFCLFLSKVIFGFSQQKVIINRGIDTLYANNFQLFIVEVPQRDSAEIIVETSQGIINSMDGSRPSIELFNISGLKKGKVLVKVFKVIGKEKIFLGDSQFSVTDRPLTNEEKKYNKLNPSPIITFCGKSRGDILLDSLKKVKKIFVSFPYTLKSATVYFGCNDVVIASLSSAELSPIFDLFKRCGDGTRITFVSIKIKDKNKIYQVPDMSFLVKDKL